MPTCRHKLAAAKGGLAIKDEGGIVPGAIKDIAARITNKIAKGDFSDILKTPAPAYVHVERTYVEGAAADLIWSSKYLTKAAETNDPIERLKLVITSYLAGNHISPTDTQCRAPLNPILGETVQRVLPDGSKFYGEQTSHHPPITNFLLEGPNNLYRFSGFFEYKAWLSGINSLGGSRIGKQIFSFNDGGLLSIKDPVMQITNLISGDRALNFTGQMLITDHINKLEVIVTYNPPVEGASTGMFKSFKSKLFGKKTEQLTDAVLIQIFQKALNGNSKEKVLVAEGSGSWLEYIQFNGKVYWTIDDEKPEWLMMNDAERVDANLREFLLPSDSQQRADMQPLKDKNFDVAEREKLALEEQQRKDKKNRHAAEKLRASSGKQ